MSGFNTGTPRDFAEPQGLPEAPAPAEQSGQSNSQVLSEYAAATASGGIPAERVSTLHADPTQPRPFTPPRPAPRSMPALSRVPYAKYPAFASGRQHKGGPGSVVGVTSACLAHILAATYLLSRLEQGPITPFGVFVTPTEQVWWGVWAMLGLALLPSAAGAVLFEIHGVLEWYGHYLVATVTILFCFLIRIGLLGSVCADMVPAKIQSYSGAIVCAMFDLTVTSLGLVVLGAVAAVVLWLFLVAQRLHALEPELPIPPPYGTFEQKAKAVRTAPFRVPPEPPPAAMKEEALRRVWEERVKRPRGPGEHPHEQADKVDGDKVELPPARPGPAAGGPVPAARGDTPVAHPGALQHQPPPGETAPNPFRVS